MATGLLLGLSTASAQSCCSTGLTQLQFDTPVTTTVAGGTWKDFYFVAENDGDSLTFEVAAHHTAPTALSVFALDGRVADITTPTSNQCRLCPSGTPTGASITTVESLHPLPGTNSRPFTASAVDSDTVSFIGNSTHRMYYAYVGECYHMVGSVYYLSVFGGLAETVTFTAKVSRVLSALPIGTQSAEQPVSGTVCDGKYMHYYVDWSYVAAGGLHATVKKTGGELDAFYFRDERCAGAEPAYIGAKGNNMFGPINLRSYGLSSGSVRLPHSGHSLTAGRYYLSIRAAEDLCGFYTISMKNLTQHEFHALSKTGS